MNTDAMRAAFEAWVKSAQSYDTGKSHIFDLLETGEYRLLTFRAGFEAWQAATAEERERVALVCERLGMATNGMYERNHECAAAIRSGK